MITLIGFTGLSAKSGKMPEAYDNIVTTAHCSAKTNYNYHDMVGMNRHKLIKLLNKY